MRPYYVVALLLAIVPVALAVPYTGYINGTIDEHCSVHVFATDIPQEEITFESAIPFTVTEFRVIPVTGESDRNFVHTVYAVSLSSGETDAVYAHALIVRNTDDPDQKVLILPVVQIPRRLNYTVTCDVHYSFYVPSIDAHIEGNLLGITPGEHVVSHTVSTDEGNATISIGFTVPDPTYRHNYPGTTERISDYILRRFYYNKYHGISTDRSIGYTDFLNRVKAYIAEQNVDDTVLKQVDYAIQLLRGAVYSVPIRLYPYVPDANLIRIEYASARPDIFDGLMLLSPVTFAIGANYVPPDIYQVDPPELSLELDDTYTIRGVYVITFGPAEVEENAPIGEQPAVFDLRVWYSPTVVRVNDEHTSKLKLSVYNPNDIDANVRICFYPVNVRIAPTDANATVSGDSVCSPPLHIPPYEDISYSVEVLYTSAPDDTFVAYTVDAMIYSEDLLTPVRRHYTGKVEVRSAYYGVESFCLDENTLAIVKDGLYVERVVGCSGGTKCYDVGTKAVCFDHKPLPGEITAKEYRDFIESKGDPVSFLLFGATGLAADAIELYLGVKLGEIPLMAGVGGMLLSLAAIAVSYFIYRAISDKCALKNYLPFASLITGLLFGSVGVLALNVAALAICKLSGT